jgi:endogenous inhibitor of DNA gyrase (YacG/DUF329 family)
MRKCKKCENQFEPKKGLISYCSLACRNSRTWSEADKNKKSDIAKKSDKIKLANKLIGLTRVKERIEKKCETCNSVMNLLPSNADRLFCSNKCYLNSKLLKNSGGYRKGSGVGKKGWYKGYWCDSSWELAWVIYHLEHNIFFERNFEGFKYYYNGKIREYYPDFIIGEVYYEIKGYMTNQTVEKIKQFKGKIKIIDKFLISPIINYVKNKYGVDYIKLYDNNPHNKLTKNCPICNGPCKDKNIVCSRICSGKLMKNKQINNL